MLLHVTSLPSRFGIDDLGPTAFEWVDWLAEADCRYWQLLPLGPTGLGNSPYSSFSSFAGNATLISSELLVDDGLLNQKELSAIGAPDAVLYEDVVKSKTELLRVARSRLKGDLRSEFDEFCEAEAEWLDSYSLFMALKGAHDGGELGHCGPKTCAAGRCRLCQLHVASWSRRSSGSRLVSFFLNARGIACIGMLSNGVFRSSEMYLSTWLRTVLMSG